MCSSSIDICELSLKAGEQGSMKAVMLSSDSFTEGGTPVATHHVDFKTYFFELYYAHMSSENTLGVLSGCSQVSSQLNVRGAASHIVSWLHHKYFN